MLICDICGNRVDPVWVEAGYTRHFSCSEIMECGHGEPRGARYCALCRYSRTDIVAPGLTRV